MATESLPTASLSGKPADLESTRLSLARVEIACLRDHCNSMAAAMNAILAMDDMSETGPVLDFLDVHENTRKRLDTIKELIGKGVAA